MPLIVGIENGYEKGFTESEISLVNGFGFGMLAINAGVGSMSRSKRGVNITPEVFRMRMLRCNDVIPIFDMPTLSMKLTIEFCERLQAADWSCNVTNLSDEDFEIAFNQWSRRVRNVRGEEE